MKKSKRSKEEIEEVKRLMGLHPIVDAQDKLRFVIKKSDVDNAVMGDFQACAMAVALKNMSGVNEGIVVFPSTVYVPWDKKGDGNFIIERYNQPSKAKRAIKEFDTTGVFPLGEYILTPPSKSSSLKGKKIRNTKRRADPAKRKADSAHKKESAHKIKNRRTIQSSQPEMSFLEIRRGGGRAGLVKKSLIRHPKSPSPTIAV